MKSSSGFELPGVVPVMTLSDVVLFPQATLPLYIFEPRYRKMLADSLASHSLFGIATLDKEAAERAGTFEPLHGMATLGIVRTSQSNDDGTSSILVQGLTRMRVLEIVSEEPYRTVRIEPLMPLTDDDAAQYTDRMKSLLGLVRRRNKLGDRISTEMLKFLSRIDDPEIFADIVAYALLNETADKLAVLDAEDIEDRYAHLFQVFRTLINDAELRRKLQGGLEDRRIDLN